MYLPILIMIAIVVWPVLTLYGKWENKKWSVRYHQNKIETTRSTFVNTAGDDYFTFINYGKETIYSLYVKVIATIDSATLLTFAKNTLETEIRPSALLTLFDDTSRTTAPVRVNKSVLARIAMLSIDLRDSNLFGRDRIILKDVIELPDKPYKM